MNNGGPLQLVSNNRHPSSLIHQHQTSGVLFKTLRDLNFDVFFTDPLW